MLTPKNSALFAGLSAACLTIYYLSQSTSTTTDLSANMANSPSNQQAHQPTVDDLRIFLSHTWLPVPTVKVTIQNAHPTTPMSFLTWDTPIDKSSLNTGVLQLTDAVSGESIEGPGLKLSRLLPPPREDLVEVAAQDVVEVDIELKAPWIPSSNKLVKVHAEGAWKAVWAKGKNEVTDEELNDMSGPGVLQGPFRSVRDVELELSERE
ncbi:hypothetical protein CERZMDRAFT_91923 [Cercospora zeae-maydis SCOH1-5]|uniref:Secreted protein n=1 Tax=Cercospora zeae-maydis SCOH1-5 TaxID=717836 RepID=A0A6A6F087_9PEZI|nr:hypothetical protein CERZMDRAFT_91923 [Cercospora zeae-maydis SCOH1-5]